MIEKTPPILPPVPEMLDQLEQAYSKLAAAHPSQQADVQRLIDVLADFRWYGERLEASRWEKIPREGRWSFAMNLWHITEQAVEASDDPGSHSLRYFVDHGKEHIGQIAELLFIISDDEGCTL